MHSIIHSIRAIIRHINYPPIYLFQMGKVGSSSLKATLSKKYKGTVIHAHNYDMMSLQSKKLLKWRKYLHLPIYVICPVREPLSRNVSAFFQNFTRDTGYNFSDQEWTPIVMRELFLNNFPHNRCLEWFDRNFRTTFGIDIFSTPFPIERKWNVYKKGSIRCLIYRSDLDASEQLEVISRFLDHDIADWVYKNTSIDKEYGDLYKQFCATVTLPEIYISIMCNSLFCRHFWNEEEIASYAQRWREK